jgi:hypothetical protein
LHAPAPSQALLPVHGVVPTLSCWFTGTLPHTPSTPPPFFAAEQARQLPLQGELQQTPSMQLPFRH